LIPRIVLPPSLNGRDGRSLSGECAWLYATSWSLGNQLNRARYRYTGRVLVSSQPANWRGSSLVPSSCSSHLALCAISQRINLLVVTVLLATSTTSSNYIVLLLLVRPRRCSHFNPYILVELAGVPPLVPPSAIWVVGRTYIMVTQTLPGTF
jgi:hypothetical protein